MLLWRAGEPLSWNLEGGGRHINACSSSVSHTDKGTPRFFIHLFHLRGNHVHFRLGNSPSIQNGWLESWFGPGMRKPSICGQLEGRGQRRKRSEQGNEENDRQQHRYSTTDRSNPPSQQQARSRTDQPLDKEIINKATTLSPEVIGTFLQY